MAECGLSADSCRLSDYVNLTALRNPQLSGLPTLTIRSSARLDQTLRASLRGAEEAEKYPPPVRSSARSRTGPIEARWGEPSQQLEPRCPFRSVTRNAIRLRLLRISDGSGWREPLHDCRHPCIAPRMLHPQLQQVSSPNFDAAVYLPVQLFKRSKTLLQVNAARQNNQSAAAAVASLLEADDTSAIVTLIRMKFSNPRA